MLAAACQPRLAAAAAATRQRTNILRCRAMLADRLLAKTDYDCDREIRTLELLKLRFGDTNLNNCEVGRLLRCCLLCWICMLR